MDQGLKEFRSFWRHLAVLVLPQNPRNGDASQTVITVQGENTLQIYIYVSICCPAKYRPRNLNPQQQEFEVEVSNSCPSCLPIHWLPGFLPFLDAVAQLQISAHPRFLAFSSFIFTSAKPT